MARTSGGITGPGGKSVSPQYKESVAPKAKPSKAAPKWEDTSKQKSAYDKASNSILNKFGYK